MGESPGQRQPIRRISCARGSEDSLVEIDMRTPATVVVGAQDWATRSTQPGVLRAIKASPDNLQAMKVGPAGQPNYYGYWVSAPWVDSYQTVVYNAALDCFQHTYPGFPQSVDAAYSTYRFAVQFSGP